MKMPRWLNVLSNSNAVAPSGHDSCGSEGTFFVVRPQPVKLPRFGGLRRNPPRPTAKRQPDYTERFDEDTLFYDVFETDEGIRLVGPPMLNLQKNLMDTAFSSFDDTALEPEFNELDRTHSALIRSSSSSVSFGLEGLRITAPVGVSYSDRFSGRKVLLTKSKNNRLEWIRDWASFHVHEHGVDAVLLYDNGSTDYNCEDILRSLSDIPGLEIAIVVDWDFKFGPQGGDWEGLRNAPWDSDFCEYGILEHARRRFLSGAAAVVSLDVDELVISESNRSLFEVLDASESGAITYEGLWIETTSDIRERVPRFQDFLHYDMKRGPSTKKWSVNPARTQSAAQWKTHRIEGVEMEFVSEIRHRHFMGINSNWKRDRTSISPVIPGRHMKDELLSDKLARQFENKAEEIDFREPVSSLVILHEMLSKLTVDIETASKIWFYRDDCLVLDLSARELGLGFDIQEVEDGFEVKVSGRNDVSRTLLVELLPSIVPNSLPVGGRHWRILTADSSEQLLVFAERVFFESTKLFDGLLTATNSE